MKNGTFQSRVKINEGEQYIVNLSKSRRRIGMVWLYFLISERTCCVFCKIFRNEQCPARSALFVLSHVCFFEILDTLNISRCLWHTSAVQKIKKLSETPVTVHNIAKLCVIDGKNREITKKLVQPVPPHPCWTHGNFNGKMTKKIKWPKITFPGSKMVPKVSKWGF